MILVICHYKLVHFYLFIFEFQVLNMFFYNKVSGGETVHLEGSIIEINVP